MRLTETKVQAEKIINNIFDQIELALINGEDVSLPKIGKLKPVRKPPRTARNPHTGEPIKVPARTVVKFTPAKSLKDSVR